MLIAAGTKVTYAMQGNGYGWSITLFLNSESPNFASELPKAKTLADKINDCLGTEAFVDFYRVQSASTKRKGALIDYPAAAGIKSTCGSFQQAAFVRCYNQTFTQSKLIFFRGFPANSVTEGTQISSASAFSVKITAFYNQLVADGWCWLGKSGGSGPIPIVSITPLATGQLDIVCANPILPNPLPFGAVNTQVAISGVKGADTANGTWVVTPNSGAPTTRFTTVRQILINPYTVGTGHASWNNEALIPIAAQPLGTPTVERVAERKAGRPLYRSRGRSSRKRASW